MGMGMSGATLNAEGGHIFDFELCRFRSLRSSSLGELTDWTWVGFWLMGKTPLKVEPHHRKRTVQKRKKPRLWESWLSLVSAFAGAFWWRGTVRNAPYFQFNGTTSSCRALNNFGKSSRPPPPHGPLSPRQKWPHKTEIALVDSLKAAPKSEIIVSGVKFRWPTLRDQNRHSILGSAHDHIGS